MLSARGDSVLGCAGSSGTWLGGTERVRAGSQGREGLAGRNVKEDKVMWKGQSWV